MLPKFFITNLPLHLKQAICLRNTLPSPVDNVVAIRLFKLAKHQCRIPNHLTLRKWLSIPICEVAEKIIGGKDPGCIVADEYLTLPITIIGLTSPWALLSGFILHRIFDITKPPPIKQLQHIHGGFGITIDDFLAALIALGLNHAIFYFVG